MVHGSESSSSRQANHLRNPSSKSESAFLWRGIFTCFDSDFADRSYGFRGVLNHEHGVRVAVRDQNGFARAAFCVFWGLLSNGGS